MLLLFLFLVVPFALFVGGAYVFDYPVTLGVLYGFNLALMLPGPVGEAVLNDYEKKVLAWKGTYVFSLLLLAVALVIFLAVSIFLGIEQEVFL